MSLPAEPPGHAPDPSGLPEPAPAAAQRERTAELLTRRYAADQLTESDFQARLDRVYRARTSAELDAALAGLPTEPPAAPDLPPIRLRALLSGQEQKLTGVLPRRLELKARLGYVELDLRNATLAEGVTEIDLRVFAGYAELRLPPGVRVESVGQALLGYIAIKGGGAASDERSTRLLRITGRVLCGYAECFRARALPPADADEPARLERGAS